MSKKTKEESKQSAGGYARAESLTKEARRAIAQKAAMARWDADVPQATHEGIMQIGESQIFAAVLPNRKRVISQATFLRALGRSRSPKAGTGVLSTVDGIPFFLQAESLKALISEETLKSTTPVFYRTKDGKKAVGYDAELLPMVAEVYLKLRDQFRKIHKPLPKQYEHIVLACEIVIRSLAKVGIVALVDEATGFQFDRDKRNLQEILQKYIADELRPWVKTFPDEYYQELFRILGWRFELGSTRRPPLIGKLTNDLVYDRLAPGILPTLKHSTPRDDKGRLKHHYHRKLTSDVGHPKLKEHFIALLPLMRASDHWDQFYKLANRALPKYTSAPLLDLLEQIELEKHGTIIQSPPNSFLLPSVQSPAASSGALS